MTQFAILSVLVVALVATLGTAWSARKRMQEIHVLVNRRLELALQEIKDLKSAREVTADIDHPRDLTRIGSAPVVPSDAGLTDDG